jgi:hypothetical protein
MLASKSGDAEQRGDRRDSLGPRISDLHEFLEIVPGMGFIASADDLKFSSDIDHAVSRSPFDPDDRSRCQARTVCSGQVTPSDSTIRG